MIRFNTLSFFAMDIHILCTAVAPSFTFRRLNCYFSCFPECQIICFAVSGMEVDDEDVAKLYFYVLNEFMFLLNIHTEVPSVSL